MMADKRSFKRILCLLFSALFFFGYRIGSALRLCRNKGCTILYYHGIGDDQRGRFASQMDSLLHWTQPVAIDFHVALREGISYSAVTFDDAFESVLRNAAPELKQRHIPFAVFVIAGALGKQMGWDGYPERVMTLKELQRLPADLAIIGSHTMTHPNLVSLDEQEARQELLTSRITLSDLMERSIRVFSFPYGALNERLVELCREAGYDKIFSTLPYLASGEPDDFVVGRVSVQPSDWPIEFYLKVKGGYRWMALAIQWKRQLVSVFRRTLKCSSDLGPSV
jgi:peptidoglycan/xylan/chitin deacetylase (PgdA/CDA1 family)